MFEIAADRSPPGKVNSAMPGEREARPVRRRRPLRSQLGAAASSGGCALLRGMFRAAHSIGLLGSPLLLLLMMALAAVAAVASAVVAPPAWVVAIGYSNSTPHTARDAHRR